MPDSADTTPPASDAPAAVVNAPASVIEGADSGISLSLVLRNVTAANGVVDLRFLPSQSTATNGADVLVPAYSGTYSISQSEAGDYTFNLPTITLNADLAREGTETLALEVHAPGVLFDNGTDTIVVSVNVVDHTPPTDPALAAIDSIYVLSGGRAASSVELRYWAGQIAAGDATLDTVAKSVLSGPLGQQHTAAVVTALYEDVFGRPASAEEISVWQSVAQGEADLNTVLAPIMSDPGSGSRLIASVIDSGYAVFSGRLPTVAEVSKWQHLLTGQLDPAATRTPHLQDFNADGHADFLWQNKSTGEITTWDTLGVKQFTVVMPNTFTHSGIDLDSTITGQLDFNGDGGSDLLVRHANGAFSIWTSTGAGFNVDAYSNDTVDPYWHIAAIGDFDGNGRDDLIFRNADGGMTEWQSTGTGFAENVYIHNNAAPGQVLVGAMDMNGDGRDDLVWRDPGTGAFSVWNATDSGFDENSYVNTSVGTDWSLAALADMNGDGRGDIVWRNDSDGTVTEWLSSGDHFDANAHIEHGVSLDWQLVQAADYNGDGMADLAFRNDQTGAVSIWAAAADHSLIADSATIDHVTIDWALLGANGMTPAFG
jgi:hypothetical protein